MASQSLGTLTLDLIAQVGGFVSGMDKAERSSAKWRKEVEKNAKAAGVAIGAGIAAGVTALGAITVGAINSAKEISNLSSVANTSTTEFQKYAAGAKLVGIEQEKLADIFKDVNDKVGDFLNTGGGALADFFTNISPKVGVTADDFRNLSGPQALGLYVQSLQKANVSQADMTFYMEAIASDATALTPLLLNNAEGFKTLGDAAEASGAILDEKTIRAANELQAATWLIEQSVTGLKNQIAAQLLPALSDMAVGLLGVNKEGQAAVVVGEFVVDTLKFMAKAAVGAVGAFDLLGKAIGGAAATAAAGFKDADWTDFAAGPIGLANLLYKNRQNIQQTAAGVGEDLDAVAQKWGGFINDIDKAGSGGTNGKIKELAELLDKLRKNGAKPGTFTALTNEEKAAQKAAEQAAKALQNRFDDAETGYEREIALINTEVDKRKDATEVAKLQFEIESGKLKGINAQQQERLNGLAAELDRLQKLKQANEDAAKAAAYRAGLSKENDTAAAALDIDISGAGLGDKTRDRLREILQIRQTYAEKLSDLAERYQSGDISKEQYDQNTKDLQNALNQRLQIQENHYEQLDKIQDDWMNGVNDAFQNYVDSASDHSQQAANAITSILDTTSSSISQNFVDILQGTESFSQGAQAVISDLSNAIIQALVEIAAKALVVKTITGIAGFFGGGAGAASASDGGGGLSDLGELLPGFASGGWTGARARNAIAGIVHGQEFVFDASSTNRIGKENLEALRSGKLDATLNRFQEGVSQTTNNNGDRNINVTVALPPGSSTKEQRSSGARIGRQIANAVDSAQRYN